jgi:hypothetical protein
MGQSDGTRTLELLGLAMDRFDADKEITSAVFTVAIA